MNLPCGELTSGLAEIEDISYWQIESFFPGLFSSEVKEGAGLLELQYTFIWGIAVGRFTCRKKR